MTRQEYISKLLRDYEAGYEAVTADRDRRLNRVRENWPDIAFLLDRGSDIAREGAARLVRGGGDPRELARDMRERAEQNERDIEAALLKHGLPADELKTRPLCPVCGDRGYIDGVFPRRYCECFEKKLALMMSDSSVSEQSFDTFDLSVFPDTVPEGSAITQRAAAERVKRFLREYTERFPFNAKPNITLMGRSGLGKSFMLDCVANALRDKGQPLMQISAYRMLEAMRRRHRGMDEGRDEFDEMLETPCLILDDLGTEPMLNNITIEYLFILLNERRLAGRATLVATNFSMKELKEHYNERIASRLLDVQNGVVITLLGSDLRTRH